MRYVLTAAAVAAIGFAALTSANAEPVFIQGGPSVIGGLCKVSGNGGDENYGYLTPCPQPVAPAPRKKKKAT